MGNPGPDHIFGYAWHKAACIFQTIYNFSIEDLIGVLSRCVECNIEPRNPLDIHTAREIVDRVNSRGNTVNEMCVRLIILKAYQIERLFHNSNLYPISCQIIDCGSASYEHYRGMVRHLGTLPREHSIYLMDRATSEVSWDHDFTHLVLGGCVWQWFYQKEKDNLPKEYGEFLHY